MSVGEILGYASRKYKDWFSENNSFINELIRAKNRAYDAAIKTDSPAVWANFRPQQAVVQRTLRGIEYDWWTNFSTKLQEYADTNQLHLFYEGLKTVVGPVKPPAFPARSADGSVLHTDRAAILTRWAEDSRELLNRRNPSDLSIVEELPDLPAVESLNESPSFEEVTSALSLLKDVKAAGLDNIPAELLKYEGLALARELHTLIVSCWLKGDISQTWNDANIVYVYKRKGDSTVRRQPGNISVVYGG